MAKTAPTKRIPKELLASYEAIVELTSAFCRDHLNDEYRMFAEDMAAALCRKRPSPVVRGEPKSWACGIIYTLGKVNFLYDPASKPYKTTAQVCAGFGVGQSTASGKSAVIWKALDTYQFDPRWTLSSLLDQNPFVWIAQVNGLLVDLRTVPREVQSVAFEQGIIPYIPADRR